MSRPFHELREQLLRAGVAPRHARRYLNELADHLADLKVEEERAGRSRTDAESAALTRLGGINDLTKAMTEQRQFHSWSVRAPWAMFSLTPLFLLAGSYLIAIIILWSGWMMFLPGADTPFGNIRVHGFANLYFQAGKMIYFCAPIFVGWGIGLIAARQRLKTIWLPFGLVLIALIGGTAQINASRIGVPGGLGHIHMDFALGASVHGIPGGLLNALVILSLTVLPYIIWRLQRIYSL